MARTSKDMRLRIIGVLAIFLFVFGAVISFHYLFYSFANIQENVFLLPVLIALIFALALSPLVFYEHPRLHDAIQSVAGIGTFLVALVGALFVLGEYEDQRQARITRAWQLLHEAKEEADRELQRALEVPIHRMIQLTANGGRCSRQSSWPDYDAPSKSENPCDLRNSFSDLAPKTQMRVLDALITTTRHQSHGQINALETLVREHISTNGANLAGFVLDGANLRGASLQSAQLMFASLVGTDLSGADLSRADLTQANLEDADLSKSILEGARLPRYFIWESADERDGRFRRAKMPSVRIRHSQFSGADFGGASLERAVVNQSSFKAAEFGRSDLEDSNWYDSDLRGARFSCANLRNATFEDVDMEGVELDCSSVSGADFRKANNIAESFRNSPHDNKPPSIRYQESDPPILPAGVALPPSRGCECDK